MNLGETTSAAFTIFEEMGKDVTYLGRDFLKCCGHDQKWQGMTEVFEKLRPTTKRNLEKVELIHWSRPCRVFPYLCYGLRTR